jgi:DNA uptake protein ComE-like DNA-binding protein
MGIVNEFMPIYLYQKAMWERIREYLTFTRKERLGVLVLLVIILLLFVLPYFIRPAAGSPDPAAWQRYQEGIRKYQSRNRPAEKNEFDERGKDTARMSTGFGNNLSGKAAYGAGLFYFDPNRISAGGWQRLGLPDKLILTISHYLQKGGSFREASDLKKIYGLKEQDFERLSPFIRIQHTADPALAGRYRKEKRGPVNGGRHREANYAEDHPRSSKYITASFSKKEPQSLDINLADSALWIRLPGIGYRLANRIVHFRNKLGGFYSVDQVKETFGLSDSVFLLIRPFLHRSGMEWQKINLNTAGQEVLQQHPYIRWKLAKQIIAYREQHGGFKSVVELQQLALVDEEVFKKLEPYLEVGSSD